MYAGLDIGRGFVVFMVFMTQPNGSWNAKNVEYQFFFLLKVIFIHYSPGTDKAKVRAVERSEVLYVAKYVLQIRA